MSTREERIAGIPRAREILELAANGNEYALEYLCEMDHLERVLDDFIDGDHEVVKEDMLKAIRWLAITCYGNKFFMANLYTLATLHGVVMSAWEESNKMEHGSDTERIYHHVLKEGFVQIITAVALMTGGYALMREVESKVWPFIMRPMEG